MGKIGGKNVQCEISWKQANYLPTLPCECVDEEELIKIGNGIAFKQKSHWMG